MTINHHKKDVVIKYSQIEHRHEYYPFLLIPFLFIYSIRDQIQDIGKYKLLLHKF